MTRSSGGAKWLEVEEIELLKIDTERLSYTGPAMVTHFSQP
jgi:hypothetical protein